MFEYVCFVSNMYNSKIILKNILKTGQNGHFGSHLGFWETAPGDLPELFISDSTHVPAPIVKKISLLPKMSTYLTI